VDDGALRTNPAIGLRRRLRIFREAAASREEPKAMTRAPLATFLEVARTRECGMFPLLFLLARTGLRLGEALALQWSDVDVRGREIRVRRTLDLNAGGTLERRLGTPKGGKTRRVDMSHELSVVLRQCQQDRRAEALRRGWSDGPRGSFWRRTGPRRETAWCARRSRGY
jgi:integrase